MILHLPSWIMCTCSTAYPNTLLMRAPTAMQYHCLIYMSTLAGPLSVQSFSICVLTQPMWLHNHVRMQQGGAHACTHAVSHAKS
jgi:hypothetical protein